MRGSRSRRLMAPPRILRAWRSRWRDESRSAESWTTTALRSTWTMSSQRTTSQPPTCRNCWRWRTSGSKPRNRMALRDLCCPVMSYIYTAFTKGHDYLKGKRRYLVPTKTNGTMSRGIWLDMAYLARLRWHSILLISAAG